MDDYMLLEPEQTSSLNLDNPSAAGKPVRATVVVPAFNTRATLGRALKSLSCQTMQDIEIIVVDDASTDGSWDLIAAVANEDPRVRAIRNPRNRGKSAGMNCGIALARGRWLALLDADDWYAPDRLAALVDIGEASCVDMVSDNQFFFDRWAEQVVGTAWRPSTAVWRLTLDGFLEAANAYASFDFGMLKPIIRTDFLRGAALNYDEEARDGHDFFHLLEFYLAGGRSAIADTPYYYYTQPFGAISRRWSTSTRGRYDFQTIAKIQRRLVSNAGGRLTRGQANRLYRRVSQLQSLEHYHEAKRCIADRDIGGAVRHLARRPGIFSYAAWRLRRLLTRDPQSKLIEGIAGRSTSAYRVGETP